MMDQAYVDTVRLLLEVAPEVFQSDCFAMKGGTALNLFVQDLPRLSVDLDVVYVAHRKGREAALAEIATELAAGPHRPLPPRPASAGAPGQSGGAPAAAARGQP